MLSQELDPVQNNWQFTEVWIDPMLTPPYVLLLLADVQGNCQIYDPAKDYTVIFSSEDYETAKFWLLEDEYEPIQGTLLPDEFVV